MKPYTIWAAFGAIALDAFAQHAAAPSPTDAAARVPQATYRSAFEGYVPYREQALAPWREVNDEVGRIGGHAGIFRGAAQAAPGTPGTGAVIAPEAGMQAPGRGAPADGKPPGKPAAGGGHHGH